MRTGMMPVWMMWRTRYIREIYLGEIRDVRPSGVWAFGGFLRIKKIIFASKPA